MLDAGTVHQNIYVFDGRKSGGPRFRINQVDVMNEPAAVVLGADGVKLVFTCVCVANPKNDHPHVLRQILLGNAKPNATGSSSDKRCFHDHSQITRCSNEFVSLLHRKGAPTSKSTVILCCLVDMLAEGCGLGEALSFQNS